MYYMPGIVLYMFYVLIHLMHTTAFCTGYRYCLHFADKAAEHKQRTVMCLRSHKCWTPELYTDFNFGTPSSGLYCMTMDKLHKLSGPQFLHLSDGDSNASYPAQSLCWDTMLV